MRVRLNITEPANNSGGGAKPLDRYLSQLDVWAMAFGCMVGWGVFAMPGTTFLPVAGPLGTVIALLLGAAVMLIVGRNFSFLMGRSSVTGGIYSYTKEAFGRDHAFISSWFLCLSYLTIVFLNGTALFYVVRMISNDSLQKGFSYEIAGNTIYLGESIVSALVLVITGLLFVAAKPFLQRLHTILSCILFAGILTVSVLCIPHALKSGAAFSFGSQGLNPAYAIFSIVIMAPWAFVGFEITSFDTAHFKFPVKKSGKLVITSVLATAFAYASMAVVSVASVPDGYSSWQEYIADLGQMSGTLSVPTFHAAGFIMGNFGMIIMTVTAVAAILTGIIGGYRATTRVLSTMAEDHILSEWFSKTTYSIFFVMILSVLISFLGQNTLTWFVDLTSFGAVVCFGYTSAAAWKQAKAEGNRRIVITGIAGTVISASFAIVQIVPRLSAMEAMGSEAFLLLSVWCLLGFLFYWRTVVNSSLAQYSGMSASGIVLFALLVYSALMWLAKRLMAKDSVEDLKTTLIYGGIIALVIIFVGMVVMFYVQNIVRKKHEESEREKIHAIESSLAKSRFLFNMSHDIRTPMNAIIGYTNLALKEPSSKTVRDFLEKIDTSSHHLLSLINDILEMSRIESGKTELELEPSDLGMIFGGMRDLFSEQMKQKTMDFSVHTGQVKHHYVWCDRKNLNRVLLNLLSNAYKFTPENGTVTVTLWEIGNGEGGYGSYEIRVQDSGIGMTKEFSERMFNTFERERTSTVSGIQGTGLGLAITKSLVDLMGGTIEVITSPGSGTEFIIRLKFRLAAEDEVRGSAVAPSSESDDDIMDFTGKRVLLVEDNEINMEIACMILEQAGFEVDTAVNGKIAVEKVKESVPGFYDLVLMDIQMPEMDGYEATRAIRSIDDGALSSIPIIAMTANAFKEDEEAAARSGMQAHIAKPVDVPVMTRTISDVLKRSRPGA